MPQGGLPDNGGSDESKGEGGSSKTTPSLLIEKYIENKDRFFSYLTFAGGLISFAIEIVELVYEAISYFKTNQCSKVYALLEKILKKMNLSTIDALEWFFISCEPWSHVM